MTDDSKTVSRPAASVGAAGEHRLAALFEQTAAGLAETTLEGRFTLVNARYCELVGRNSDELLTLQMQDITEPDDLPHNLGLFERMIESGEPFEIEKRYRRPDGSTVWVKNNVSLVRDDAGAPVSVFAVSIDISRSKEIEEALRESEARLKHETEQLGRMFAQAPVIMVMMRGPDHVAEIANAGYMQIVGHRDPVGKPMREALPELESQGFIKLLDQVYQTGEPYVTTDTRVGLQRTPNGPLEDRVMDFVYQPVTGADGKVSGILAIGTDVSERRAAEDALRTSEERLRLVIDGATDYAIFTTDPEREITSWSTGAETIFGYSADQAIGRCADNLWTPEDQEAGQPEREVATARETGCANNERWHLRSDGRRVFLNGSVHPLPPLSDGSERGFIKIARDETGRRAAEAALRESEERYRSLFTAIDAGFCIVEVEFDDSGRADDYRFIEINPAFEKQTGLVDAVGKTARALVPDLEDHWFKIYGRVAKTGHAERFENGSIPMGRWFDVYAFPSGGHGSNRVAILFTDISDRRLMEQSLRESEERYRALFNTMDEGFCVIEFLDGPEGPLSDYVHVAANPAYTAHAGIPDVVGQKVREMVPDEAEGWVALYRNVLLTGEPVRFERELVATGRHLDLSAFRVEPASRHQVAVLFQDVTGRKAAEEALSEERNRLDMLNRTGAALSRELELDKVVQMVTDAGVELTGAQFGAFFYNVLNEACESYMLYTLSGAERSDFDGFPNPRNTAVFEPTFSGTGIVRSDDITKDPRYGKNKPRKGMPKGHLPVKSYLAVPVTSHTGDVIGGLFFGHAEQGRFTERHERLMVGIAAQAAVSIDNARLYQEVQRSNETLEQRVAERSAELEIANAALRQAQKMEAIGQLTGGIAHDFNNMLTVIRGSADILQRPGIEDGKRQRYLEGIVDTADRASRLTGQLLAFARRQALRPERFDAMECVQGIAEMLHTVLGTSIDLQISADCDDCFVEADAAQFETAIVNMAINARDAMAGKGQLSIQVGRASELPPLLQTGAAGAYVAISVSDTGHGIPPEAMNKIFEPFFTTKEVGKGTGLGLSQVYGFAKQSGGEVGVVSNVGSGTSFTMYLPEADSAAAETAESRAAGPNVKPGGRVLVVEDNEEVGSFAEQALAELGFAVRLARNAEQATQILEQDQGFDVVFSDVVMPGKGGFDFAREVEQRWPELPVVLTSGYSHVLAGTSSHAFPLLHKPYSLEALQQTLLQALRR